MEVSIRRHKQNIEMQINIGMDDFPMFVESRRGLDLGSLAKDCDDVNPHLYIRAQASLAVAAAMRDWHKAMVDAVALQLLNRVRVEVWGEAPAVAPRGGEERSEGACIAGAISDALSGALRPPTLKD